MRRGYTVAEALVALSIALVALALMLGIFSATRRMTQSGDLAAALAEAAIALQILHRDLAQAVQKPGAPDARIVYLARDVARFVRGEPGPEGSVRGKLVTYRREKTAAGYFRIVRNVGGEESPLPGTYSAARFQMLPGTGGPFVRVTLHVVARDAKPAGPAKGSDEAVLTTLVRVAGPEMLGAPGMLWPFLEELKAIRITGR